MQVGEEIQYDGEVYIITAIKEDGIELKRKERKLMELSEAKELLKDWIKCEEVTIRTEENTTVYQERLELFKFLLNYIENESIPKEKIETIRDKLEFEDYYCLNNALDDLSRLLGE